MPFYGYARQDKKHRGREPISARLMADLFKTAGADRLITVDLHADQIQGFFDGPVDHLMALPILTDYVKEKYGDQQLAVVSPDAGRIKVAERWSARLGGAPLAFIHKSRRIDVANEVVANRVVGDVAGKICILTDDMIDTGGTIVKAAEACMEAGAAGVIIAATHPILSDPAVDRLKNSSAMEVVVTNTLPIAAGQAVRQADDALDRAAASPAPSARSSRTARSPRCSTVTRSRRCEARGGPRRDAEESARLSLQASSTRCQPRLGGRTVGDRTSVTERSERPVEVVERVVPRPGQHGRHVALERGGDRGAQLTAYVVGERQPRERIADHVAHALARPAGQRRGRR